MYSNRATSWRLALSAAAALALTASLAAAPVPARAELADLQFLPDGTNAIIVLRLDHLLASDGFKQLKGFQPEMEKGFVGQFGVSLSRVERMTIGGNVKGQPVMVLRLTEAATADAIRTELSKPRFDGDKGLAFREEKVGAFTLYTPGQAYRHCFCLMDDRTLLVAREMDLKTVLERGTKKPEFGDGMKTALKEMDAGAAAAFAIDLPSAMAADKGFVPPANPLFDVTQVAKNVDALVGAAGKEQGPEPPTRGGVQGREVGRGGEEGVRRRSGDGDGAPQGRTERRSPGPAHTAEPGQDGDERQHR